MPTIDHDKSSISNEAYELLSCFVNGLDNVVYDIAEKLAQQREGNAAEPIAIETKDVRQAANLVVEGIRRAVEAGHLPENLRDEVDDMARCFDANLH